MRERLKTFILLFLILTSIVLTGQLLFGLPSLETAKTPAYEQLFFGELRPVNISVLPELRLGAGNRWQVMQPWENKYQESWQAVQLLFRYSQTPSAEIFALPESKESMLLVLFPMPVSPEIWFSSQRLGSLQISALAWFEDDPSIIWYQDAGYGWLKAGLRTLPAEWDEQLYETFRAAPVYIKTTPQEWEARGLTADSDILLPAEMPELAARFILQETLDTEKLLRSIFVNTDLVRRIEERDGAFIYTDGQKGLRLFDYGELEYTSPKSAPGSEWMGILPAVRRTAQYLQLMGGWPDHLFLEQIKPGEVVTGINRNSDTWTVTFTSIQDGVRLLGPKPPVKLLFSDRGVIYYNRQIKILAGEVEASTPLISPWQAAAVLQNILLEEEKETSVLNVFPAYYYADVAMTVSQPVWSFVMSDHRVAVIHGRNGRFLNWLE